MTRRLARLLAHVRQIGGGRLDQRILFLHVPKCGGTSIRQAIGAAYGWRIGRQSRSARLDPAASWRASRLSHTALFAFREQIMLYQMCQPHLRYISGHYPLSETALDEFGDDWDVLTVLRHPVDRWFSEYFYNRHKQSPYFAHDQEIEDYIESRTGIIQARTLVRWFSGEMSEDWMRASVDRAMENIGRIAIIGFLEDLGAFRIAFRERYDVDLRIPRLNTSPRTTEQQDEVVSPAIRERVEELCADDIRVYNHALDLQGRSDH